MVKELYQQTIREVTLNVNVGRVDSVRKKSITKSGCRVYKDGFIGVAGCLGQPDETTWAAAEKALERKVPTCGPETGRQRSRDLREELLSAEEFLARTGDLLAVLREEFPDFVLSNKVSMEETEVRLSNDAGLDYVNIDRVYSLSLVVKQVGSPNVFDTFVEGQSRRFESEKWLAASREILNAHRELLPMPEEKEQLFLGDNTGGALAGFGILHSALNGQKYHTGTSLLQGKLGEKLYDERVSILGSVDGGDDMFGVPFFDAEGSTLEGDKVCFIEKGVFRRLVTDKKYAGLLDTECTAAAGGSYDDAPALAGHRLMVAPTGRTVAELTEGRDGIWVVMAGGGDWTDAGDYATPVQTAYLYRGGKLVGRLPEFSMAVKLDELFGSRFVGCSTDRFLGQRVLAHTGTIL